MKRTIALILAVAMTLALLPVSALAAGGELKPEKTEVSVNIGDTVSPASFGTIRYVVDGNDVGDVAGSCTLGGKKSIKYTYPGVYTVKLAYKPGSGQPVPPEKELKVIVLAQTDALAIMRSESLNARIAATGLLQGDTLSQSDFIVKFVKAGQSDGPVVTEYTFKPKTLDKVGQNEITFQYNGLTATHIIENVLPKNDPKLIVQGTCKTEYGLGEAFDPTGLTFIWQPRNSQTDAQVDVTSSVTFTPNTVFSEKGDKTITFSYTDANGDTATVTKDIKVVGLLKTFELTGTVKSFRSGDVFSPVGLTATIYDYAGKEIVKHVFTDADNGDFSYSKNLLKAGQNTVEITYTHPATGEKISRNVDVNVQSKLKEIRHTAGEIKTYYVGDTFDPTGLTFEIVYNEKDSSGNYLKETITGATAGAYSRLSYPTAPFTTKGAYTLPVSYRDDVTGETVTCNLVINIKDAKAAKIDAATVQPNLEVVVGDDFDPDKLFEVQYQAPNTEGFKKLSYAKGEYTVSPAPAAFTEAGTQTFTVKKGDVSATVTLTVLPAIKSMTVSGLGSVKLYAGYPFDLAPATVTITFNRGTLWEDADVRQPIELNHNMMDPYEGLTWPEGTLQAGEKTIKLTYTDEQTGEKIEKDVTVNVLPLLKELKIDASGITFHADDTLDLSDALVTLTDNRGTSPIIDGKKLSEVAKMAEYSVSYDKVTLKTGNNQKVTVALTHKASGETITCDVLINVQKTTYAFVAEIGAPKKTDYTEGEMFDPSGIAWKIKRNGTEELTVTSGFKTYPDRPLTPADTSVTVVYGDVARVYPVNVAGRTLVSIAVTTMPQIASFYVGQTFDPTGMVVTATYNNKTTAEVKGYTYDKTAFAESDIGTKKITLTYKEGDMTATTTISMPIVAAPVRAMTVVLDKATITTVESKTESLKATVYPTNATNQSLVWASSNTAVARVDQAGTVTAVGKGVCVITATTTDGSSRYADCYVVVQPKVAVKQLVLKSNTMELLVNDSTVLTATITPDNATYNKATWTSSDSETVSVDETGKITGLKLGSANITATADGISATMTIKVVKELTKYGTVVNCSRRVNVRSAADGGAKAIGYATLGATYTILGESGNWYKIQYTASQVGYIWKEYLQVTGKSYVSVSEGGTTGGTTGGTAGGTAGGTGGNPGLTPIDPSNPSGTKVYTKLTVTNCKRYCYVRKGASTSTSKAGHAKPGETYKLLGLSGDWYLIDFKGAQVYIYKTFGKLS